jgi:hypothetical protein
MIFWIGTQNTDNKSKNEGNSQQSEDNLWNGKIFANYSSKELSAKKKKETTAKQIKTSKPTATNNLVKIWANNLNRHF